MPYGNALECTPIRMLIYGAPRLRKTWWSLQAAEAGFNVLQLDGEDKSSVVHNLTPAAQNRIRIIRGKDQLTTSVYAELVTRFCRNLETVWDDTRSSFPNPLKGYTETSAHFLLSAPKLTLNDVLIIDSWTALQYSVCWRWFSDNGVDISTLQRSDGGYDLYLQAQYALNWMINALTSLNCHLIVVGHEQTIELTRKQLQSKRDGSKIEAVPTGEQKIVPVSSSKAHSMTLAKNFTDILHFSQHGNYTRINSRTQEGRDGGAANLLGEWNWEDIRFEHFVSASKGIMPTPDADMPGCVYYPAQQVPQAPPVPSTLDGSVQGTPASLISAAGVQVQTPPEDA